MLRLLIVLLLLGLVLVAQIPTPPARHAETLNFDSANARVIDADTIAVGASAIRLSGIAAPEKDEPGFVEGKQYLGTLLRTSRQLTCDLTHEETYGRRVGRCYLLSDGAKVTDIQQAVIDAGHARPCLRYGGWRYWSISGYAVW